MGAAGHARRGAGLGDGRRPTRAVPPRQRAGGRWRSWPALRRRAARAGRHARRAGGGRGHLAAYPPLVWGLPGGAGRRAGPTARRCPDCGLYVPLRLSPAVLAAITRPGRSGGPTELLLVRHASGPTELWALVAGFVEAGESLETAVRREVTEEVRWTSTRSTYSGSQPWADLRAGGAARRLHRHRRLRPRRSSRWWTARSWCGPGSVPGEDALPCGAAAGVLDLPLADRRRRRPRLSRGPAGVRCRAGCAGGAGVGSRGRASRRASPAASPRPGGPRRSPATSV